jgi:hypothetical protein
MGKRQTYNIITGSDKRLRLNFYYSPHFDQNIWRHLSTLTGERTRKDPAFKGFRQSGNRMKEASPIAASLYKLVPTEIKQYSLYRTLTGEALKMLKEGIDSTLITETLKKKYIDPLLDAPDEIPAKRPDAEPTKRDRPSAVIDFTAYPAGPSGARSIRSRRRARVLPGNSEGCATTEYAASNYKRHQSQTGIYISESPESPKELPDKPPSRNKTTNGLVYLCRLREYKKLKIWVRPSIVELPAP